MDDNQNTTLNVLAGIAMLGFLVWLATQMAINPANAQVLTMLGLALVLGIAALGLGALPSLFRRRGGGRDSATG
jgi:NADH:ubiquinone oxidoreductase subunit K